MEESLEQLFNKSAASYDENYAGTRSLKDALHLGMRAVFADLPEDAKVLCVGAGTGQEVFYLAQTFPKWRFTIVEPASAMLAVCQKKALEQGVSQRCTFHGGYLETLAQSEPFDAATSILVSQFLTEQNDREAFFRAIAGRLQKGGLFINADLAGDMDANNFKSLFKVWTNMQQLSAEKAEELQGNWKKLVAFVPVPKVEEIISSSGFDNPVLFYQAAFIHAWFAKRVD